MSASSVKAGEAYVIISAKLDQLRADLNKGKSEISGWGSSLGNISSIVGGAFTAAFAGGIAMMKSFADSGSEINDMAARTGIAASKLQELKFAAGQTGAGLEDIEKAAKKFVQGGGDIRNFERMGESIATIADPSQRAAMALDVFGKSGTKLIPMFSELKSLKEASAAVGPILTDAEVRSADALGDSFSALGVAVKRALDQIAASFGPQLKAVLDTMIGMIAQFTEIFKSNPFGSGGDWLDKFSEFMNTPFEDFQKRGARASTSFSQSSLRLIDPDEEAAKATRETINANREQLAIWRSIEQGNKARIALIESFATPAEKFLMKQKEINEALKQLNRNRVLGFVDDFEAASQKAGLQEAQRRLAAEEMKRRADLIKPIKQELPRVMEAVLTSKGTFSAAGASMLGRAGDSLEFRESKEQTKELKKIATNTAKITAPKFR